MIFWQSQTMKLSRAGRNCLVSMQGKFRLRREPLFSGRTESFRLGIPAALSLPNVMVFPWCFTVRSLLAYAWAGLVIVGAAAVTVQAVENPVALSAVGAHELR